ALAEALKNNPDLRVALGKLHAAEAEASRARLQVVQKVVVQYQRTEQAQATVATAEATFARIRALKKTGAVSAEEALAAEATLAQAKMNLAAARAEMDYLLGKSARPVASRYKLTKVPGLALYEGAFLNSLNDRAALEAWLSAARPTVVVKAPM